jgi:uncharacterized protein (DUF302 family)
MDSELIGLGRSGDHAYRQTVHLDGMAFPDARDALLRALALAGFSLLGESDLQSLMKRRLDREIGPFLLFDVLHPKLTEQALAIEPGLGLVVPCRVALWTERGTPVAGALRPEALAANIDIPALDYVIEELHARLQHALGRLRPI